MGIFSINSKVIVSLCNIAIKNTHLKRKYQGENKNHKNTRVSYCRVSLSKKVICHVSLTDKV